MAVGWYVGFPGINTWWQNRRGVFTVEFRQFVEARYAKVGPTDAGEWAPSAVLPQLRDHPDIQDPPGTRAGLPASKG